MPIEIKSRAFAFTSSSIDEESIDFETQINNAPTDSEESLTDTVVPKRLSDEDDVGVDIPETTVPVLRHIPLHDMEGFWWVSIILSVWRAVQGAKYKNVHSQARAESFRRFAHDMFADTATRRNVMIDNYTFNTAIRLLHPHLRVAGSQLELARRVLNKAYRVAESDLNAIKTTVPDSVYSSFIRAYKAIALDLKKQGDFDLTPMNATFLNIPEEPNPPLAGLSLDSRKAQLGKRTRTDAHLEDALDTAANDADTALTASTSAKRMKQHRDEDTVVSPSQQADDEGSVIRDTDGGEGSATDVLGDKSEEA